VRSDTLFTAFAERRRCHDNYVIHWSISSAWVKYSQHWE